MEEEEEDDERGRMGPHRRVTLYPREEGVEEERGGDAERNVPCDPERCDDAGDRPGDRVYLLAKDVSFDVGDGHCESPHVERGAMQGQTPSIIPGM